MPRSEQLHAPVSFADLLALGSDALGGAAEAAGECRVTDVTHDSRRAGPGMLFACRPGVSSDGHDHAGEAVAAGAAALLVERWLPLDVPQLKVASVACAIGPVSARVHGDPSSRLRVVGVTGTNGKTTSAYLVEAAMAGLHRTTGLVGTIETRIARRVQSGVRTTPEATDLQRLLGQMVDTGVTDVAMEVSSHGLELGRVRGTKFAVAVFTNLSQDHLDFHRTMEAYFAAKARLFDERYCSVGVVNVDDAYGRRLAEQAQVEIVRMSATGAAGADVVASDVRTGRKGTEFVARLRTGQVPVRTSLVGEFTVANALGALAAVEAGGADPAAAAAGIAALPGVPGRMERVEAGQDFTVLVDYAHTPDSVERVLAACRALTNGRVLVVLGCGGDRDRGKRPLMGAAAASGSNLAVLTSDNPRSEDPESILATMAEGAKQSGGAFEVVVDRRAAIAHALDLARPGDVVLVAGKGHERTQEVAGVLYPFDDRAVVAELLRGDG